VETWPGAERDPPPDVVLEAFGLTGPAVHLAGGRGTSWRAGGAVLKPLDGDPALVGWQAGLLRSLDRHRDEFRVSVPLPTGDGSWQASGWTAWRYEPGRARRNAWHAVLDVGDRFHRALRGAPAPPQLAARTDRWAVADRIAWGEPVPEHAAGTPHLGPLLQALRPVIAPAQLVHGDLSGNVLFEPGSAPLVLDFSPYWRPPAFASAVVVVDALVNEEAPAAVIERAADGPDARQYLLRALVFRLIAEHLSGDDPDVIARRYERAVALVTGSIR
jgi:uncharacterized protein (TIGR02569 family)